MTDFYSLESIYENIVLWENRDCDEEFELELDYEDYMSELDWIIVLPEDDKCNFDDSLFWWEMSYYRFDIWNLWNEQKYTKTDWEEFVESRLNGNAFCM